jgi:hypothetical protein
VMNVPVHNSDELPPTGGRLQPDGWYRRGRRSGCALLHHPAGSCVRVLLAAPFSRAGADRAPAGAVEFEEFCVWWGAREMAVGLAQ